jgi:hypothetical protein
VTDDAHTSDGPHTPSDARGAGSAPTPGGAHAAGGAQASASAHAAGSEYAPGSAPGADGGERADDGERFAAAGRPAGGPERRDRRRRLLWIGLAAAAVVVLVVCAGFGAVAAGVGRLVRHADDAKHAQSRAEAACLALERRLNRLAPPGSAGDPGRRAAAIRDENAAVQPFLSEVDQLGGHWFDDEEDGDDDGDRIGAGRGWADGWRELVNARTSYADALDRQVTNGEPAFFIAPQDRRGRPLLDRLERGPHECAGPARRLAAPDL